MDTVYTNYTLSSPFNNVKDEVMTRAVRVKKAITEKLQKHLSFKEEVKNDVSTVEKENESDSLKEKLIGLIHQGKVEAKVKRMVLYTKDLADKNARILEKTFGTLKDIKEEDIKVENPTVSPSGVISDSWDNVIVKEEPIVNETKVEENMPVKPVDKVEEPKENVLAEESNEDVYQPQEETKIEVKEPETVNDNSLDFSFPNSWTSENENNDVKVNDTPKSLIPTNSLTDGLSAMLSRNLKPEPVASKIDIEIPKPTFEAEKEETLSSSSVLAKVKMTKDRLRDEQAKNAVLTSRVDSLEAKNSESKDKIRVLEAFIKDVVKENGRLTSENTQLSGEVKKLKTNVEALSDTNKRINDDQRKVRQEESSKYIAEIASLKEQFAKEKEELRIEYTQKLESSKASHKKAMEELYRTLSEALGEPVKGDDDYQKVA
jgi:hypothetical protein